MAFYSYISMQAPETLCKFMILEITSKRMIPVSNSFRIGFSPGQHPHF